MSTQSFKEASALLDLLHDYLEASSAPSLPVLAESVCSTAVKGLQRALMMKGPLQSWPRQAIAVMQGLLKLDTILLQRCQVLCSRLVSKSDSCQNFMVLALPHGCACSM